MRRLLGGEFGRDVGELLTNDFPNNPNTELDFDQIAYSLPTASGQAINTVEAVERFVIVAEDLQGPLEAVAEKLGERNPNISTGEVNELAQSLIEMREDEQFFEMLKAMREG